MLEKLRKLLVYQQIGKKNFAGNLFDRFLGLEFILDKCSGSTVLDVGSNEGLISYEFAKRGSKLIHGFEKEKRMIRFTKRLFRDIPIENKFIQADLAISGEEFAKRYQDILLNEYDIVLFLGVYHHLKYQMAEKDLHNLVELILAKSKKWFVVRTNMLPEFESIILDKKFQLVSSAPPKGNVGLLHIYEKKV
jgi:2-polyprenyl-3-methyl-5-hydroxy-6-metoxy-1,4-benzoquinol methylase